MGDSHLAQGELDGTAIETSITGDQEKKLTLDTALGGTLKALDYPLLENRNEYVVHGFSYKNYSTDLVGYSCRDSTGIPMSGPTGFGGHQGQSRSPHVAASDEAPSGSKGNRRGND